MEIPFGTWPRCAAGIQTEASVEADCRMRCKGPLYMVAAPPWYSKRKGILFYQYNLLERYALGGKGPRGGKCAPEPGQALLGLHAVHQKLKQMPGDHSGCDAEVLKATGGLVFFFGLKIPNKALLDEGWISVPNPVFVGQTCWEKNQPTLPGMKRINIWHLTQLLRARPRWSVAPKPADLGGSSSKDPAHDWDCRHWNMAKWWVLSDRKILGGCFHMGNSSQMMIFQEIGGFFKNIVQ